MIYLVIAAAVILGEPTELRPIPLDDCIRVRKIEVAKPHPVKRVLVHKRLFRVEPKPVEEECEHPAPTVTTFFPPVEEPPEFTPAPPETFAAVPDGPIREDEPGASPLPAIFAEDASGPAAFITRTVAGPCCYYLPTMAPPIPEPSALWLTALGIPLLWRRRCS